MLLHVPKVLCFSFLGFFRPAFRHFAAPNVVVVFLVENWILSKFLEVVGPVFSVSARSHVLEVEHLVAPKTCVEVGGEFERTNLHL